MTISVAASGTQTATVGTDHTLASPTTAGVYQFVVDAANLVAGDILELRIESKVLTGGTVRKAFTTHYGDAQSDPIKISPPVTVPFGANFILNQVAGTGRAFDWSVIQLA